MNASTEMKLGTHLEPLEYVMKKALLNATIMLIIETNSATSPDINFKGSDLRKSSSAYREMRMDKKMRIEVEDEINAMVSDNANTRKAGFFK